MKYEEYKAKRSELLDSAQQLVDTGNADEADLKLKEVENLDNNYDKGCKTLANLAALQGTNLGRGIGVVSDTTTDNKKDEATLYKEAFANYLMGNAFTPEQGKAFNSYNPSFANTNTTTATNPVVIPETVKAQIWEEIGEQHPIFGDAAPTFVKGDLTIIKDSGTADAAWYDEPTATTSDAVAFATITLKSCELSKAITVSWKLKKMAMEDFLAYITRKIAEKMGNALANGLVNGTGADETNGKDQPVGIVTALNGETNTPQVVSTTSAFTYDNLTTLFSKIKSGYSKVIYANSKTIWTAIATIKDSTGRPIFITNAVEGGVGRLFGYVVKEEDAIADDTILVGDVGRGYAININENVTMHFEDHIKERTTDYMGYAIVDGNVLTTKAFALLVKKNS